MPVTTQRALDYLEIEWPAYLTAFHTAVPQTQTDFLKAQGYVRFADLLAHISVWWEEALGIMTAVVEGHEFERKRYNFDEFNAAAVARFKDASEADVIAFLEDLRQKLIGFLRAHPNAVEEHRRVGMWFYSVVIHHAAEHSFAASRFLVLDWLKNDWAEYLEDFTGLAPERQQKFLEKQGFPRFRDLAAHVIAWWGEAYTGIREFAKDSNYKHPSRDIDAFNTEAVERYGKMKEEQVWTEFESARLKLVELITDLPEEVLRQGRVQAWLVGDVIEHYFDHQL